MEYYQVMVKDAAGGIVYTSVVVAPSKCHNFDVSGLITEGEYLLEVEVDGQTYCGSFPVF